MSDLFKGPVTWDRIADERIAVFPTRSDRPLAYSLRLLTQNLSVRMR
jgi:hypothetical protein